MFLNDIYSPMRLLERHTKNKPSLLLKLPHYEGSELIPVFMFQVFMDFHQQ